MKHKIIILITFLLITFQGITQVKPFRFGVKLAPNLSWMSTDTEGYESDGMQMGFSWGFLADITLTENYFVKTGYKGTLEDYIKLMDTNPEAVKDTYAYFQKTGYKGSEEDEDVTIGMNMNWLNVPVLAVFDLGVIKVFGGPYFDIFLNGTMKFESTYAGETIDEETDIESEDINSFVYGAVAGVSLKIIERVGSFYE